MLRELRLWKGTAGNLLRNTTVAVRAAIRCAYKESYFKYYASATVLSGDVSLSAQIGKRVYISKRVKVFPKVQIGAYTAINEDCLIESGTIGRFCSLAANVSVGMEEHPTHHLSTHAGTYSATRFGLISAARVNPQTKAEPLIGNDVWIARGAMVLRGVRIGDGAVIGAGAVVTRDVPPYAVVAGCPARLLRYRFEEKKIEALLQRRWWADEDFIAKGFQDRGIGLDELEADLFGTTKIVGQTIPSSTTRPER